MGCCASQPEGPVQLTLHAGKVRSSAGECTAGQVEVCASSGLARPEVVSSGAEGQNSEGPIGSSPFPLLHRGTGLLALATQGQPSDGRAKQIQVGPQGIATGELGTSSSSSPGSTGLNTPETSSANASQANSSDSLGSGAIPEEPRSSQVLASPTAQQDSPATRRSTPAMLAQPRPRAQLPQRLDLRHSLAARMMSNSMQGLSMTEQQATSFIMLQYRDLRPEDFELLCNLDEGVPRRGTAPRSLVQSFPRMKACDCDVTECRVCLQSVSPQDQILRLPCQHGFHEECITKWACEYRGDCPLCGKSLVPSD